jgi:hypothetical protein
MVASPYGLKINSRVGLDTIKDQAIINYMPMLVVKCEGEN